MPRIEADDAILVTRACRGDSVAFEALVRRYASAAFAVALVVVANRADAEDVCQEAWVRALEKLEQCRERDRFAAWLLRIVRNGAINYVKRRQLRESVSLQTAPEPAGADRSQDPLAELERRSTGAFLDRAIAQLPSAQRQVLLLYDLGGLKHRDVAEDIGISEVLSRQLLFQARARLRRLLSRGALGGE